MEWRFGGTADLGGPALSAGGRGTGAPDIREGGRCFLVSSGGGPPLPPGRRLLGGPEIEYGRYGGFADGPGPGAPSEPGARPATRPGGLGGVATGGPDMVNGRYGTVPVGRPGGPDGGWLEWPDNAGRLGGWPPVIAAVGCTPGRTLGGSDSVNGRGGAFPLGRCGGPEGGWVAAVVIGGRARGPPLGAGAECLPLNNPPGGPDIEDGRDGGLADPECGIGAAGPGGGLDGCAGGICALLVWAKSECMGTDFAILGANGAGLAWTRNDAGNNDGGVLLCVWVGDGC
jgi:hypothetical protein